MSHDDPGAKDATKEPPDCGSSSLLRTGSSPSLARVRWAAFSGAVLIWEMRAAAILILVAGPAGCAVESVFDQSSGSLHFEGSDPMGAFSGDVKALSCSGRFTGGGGTSVGFGGTGRIAVLDGSVHVSTHGGGGWSVDRSRCGVFEVHKWFDAEKHLHVVVVLDDCTTPDGVRVWGKVRSDACEIMRPY